MPLEFKLRFSYLYTYGHYIYIPYINNLLGTIVTIIYILYRTIELIAHPGHNFC